MAQGTSRKVTLEMITDALDQTLDGTQPETFFLTGTHSNALLAFLLKRQREKADLTPRQVRLGKPDADQYSITASPSWKLAPVCTSEIAPSVPKKSTTSSVPLS